QVEFANTILSSGSDLLILINDVLDLTKVEAGKMDVSPTEIELAEVTTFVDRNFRQVAEQKDLVLETEVKSGLPQYMYTDGQRLQQVIKNLVANAIKFTEKGKVTFSIRPAEPGRRYLSQSLQSATSVVAFTVTDTGIGIPRDKQRLIFEAFQQADGTTNRKFGGTGLGLSISREIARILGGEIRVESEAGKGSTFTLFLPEKYHPEPGTEHSFQDEASVLEPPAKRPPRRPENQPHRPPHSPSSGAAPAVRQASREPREEIPDDRAELAPGDRVVLVVENDPAFAKILLGIARDRGFKGIVALDGNDGLTAVSDYRPDAITLDIDLPGGIDGWGVLDRLKHNPDTRHIPVHIISGVERRQQGLKAGALAYLEKPVSKDTLDDAFGRIATFIDQRDKHLLIVEDDDAQRNSMVELIDDEDVTITAVSSAEAALEELARQKFDCMVVDLGLRDMSGFDLLERVKQDPEMKDMPIIIYTGKELTSAEDTRLRKYAETIIVKDVKSPERLLDETALFLHRVEAKLPDSKRAMLERLHSADSLMGGKRVLVVDDDVRNIFSLTSVLEAHGMEVSFAENGRDAITSLEKDPSLDLVLMDVMMPEMDGYETMAAIREKPKFAALPIIALTAKAMKGDREKCIAAGASDYITKPVDTEQLLSLMRVWLYR
ncbi:MAG: response regulator, partial [Gemmatimonadaceae bacterium]|nr:response regulator [Gemmatimonadaceae bacterium]